MSQALPPDYTLPMYLKRFNKREFSFRRTDGRFVIEYKPTGDFCGTISYTGVQPRLSATVGLAIDKHFWGSGVALDAQETLLRFLFNELGLRRVDLWTNSGNKAAVGLAKKSGFKEAVRVREAIWLHGQLSDNLVMDLLREEWYALHPEYDDNLPPVTP